MGSFGKVYKVNKQGDNKDYALKVISKIHIEKLQLQKQLNREIDILMKISHEHIIKLYAAFEDHQQIYLVLEYA